MKVEWCTKVGYMDINPVFRIRLGAVSRMLQEAAVAHSEQVGIRSRDLVNNGTAWVLNRMAFDFRRLPNFGEDIRVVTWHKGSQGFRAYRDFEVRAGDEHLVSVVTIWLFIDLEKKKPRRIPSEWPKAYTIEDGDAIDFDLKGWQPVIPAGGEKAIKLSLRSSDFDPHGHVNNTAYFDFLETLLARTLGEGTALDGLRIQFRREIPQHFTSIRAGFTPTPKGAAFRIYQDDFSFVLGEIDLPASPPTP